MKFWEKLNDFEKQSEHWASIYENSSKTSENYQEKQWEELEEKPLKTRKKNFAKTSVDISQKKTGGNCE